MTKSRTNRLIHEKSPYLLQHAHNPVDWYPWGEEAFAAARDQDKPIFLSIGYATCHWCHVMERESFEDAEVGRQMNKTFICIKVDREELPQVDALYMEFAQSMMAGAGGWPLNLVLTPELEPFFAATYLPPEQQQGMVGMRELIARIQQIWSGDEREHVIDQAQRIVEMFSQGARSGGDKLPDAARCSIAAEMLFKMADPIYGGMKGAPKFPIGYQGDFLLAYSRASGETRALFLVERTLEMMHRGGIWDHLGGGFSRYSVDEKWLVPHFEKMLYDNAILAYTYLLAWQATKRPLFAQVCREILDYVLRDMTHEEGGFYSAEDADSEGVEGLFYTWTFAEVMRAIKPKSDAEIFCYFYDITKQGNFEERNILNTPLSVEEFSAEQEMDPIALEGMLADKRKQLWKIREKRVHPLKDDKILSGWNGLMIAAMVQAGCALGEKRYLEAAERAARFLREKLWTGGHLLRRWREGEASFAGGLEEYAFLIRGVLSLFEAGCGAEWLEWALEMTRILDRDFKEANGGAFYQTDGKDKNIILRKMQFSDGAEPSGNAVHCENLLKLWQITRDNAYRESAEDILRAAQPLIDHYPPGYTYHLMNILTLQDRRAPVIVIVLDKKRSHFEEIRKQIYSRFIPHRTLIWVEPGDELLEKNLLYTKEYRPIEGRTTLNICYEGICLAPLSDINEVFAAIDKL